MVIELVLIIWGRAGEQAPSGGFAATPEGYSNTEALGAILYTEHVYAFAIGDVLRHVAGGKTAGGACPHHHQVAPHAFASLISSRAPRGQILAHRPHRVQSSFTSIQVSTSSRAPAGHTPTQAPQ